MLITTAAVTVQRSEPLISMMIESRLKDCQRESVGLTGLRALLHFFFMEADMGSRFSAKDQALEDELRVKFEFIFVRDIRPPVPVPCGKFQPNAHENTLFRLAVSVSA
jgi:hypothetical protein